MFSPFKGWEDLRFRSTIYSPPPMDPQHRSILRRQSPEQYSSRQYLCACTYHIEIWRKCVDDACGVGVGKEV